MILDYGNQTVKFLSLANSGGAVTLLAFVGNFPEVRLPLSWKALSVFVVGFVLAGLVSILNFFAAWYMGTHITRRGPLDLPKWFLWSIVVQLLVGLSSLVCFSWGAWISIATYRNL